ncbi:MAG TPA: hypothetical protein PKD12_17895 [Nitrospira sp.]|nr:hypothetical protein [Nitrospira sp.]
MLGNATPLVMLHGRVMFRNRDGEISDETQGHLFGLKRMAENGELAIHILKQCLQRLELLALATESRPQLDAELVRMVVEDLLIELRSGSDMLSYVETTQEMFANSEALSPIPPPATRDSGSSLALVEPAS